MPNAYVFCFFKRERFCCSLTQLGDLESLLLTLYLSSVTLLLNKCDKNKT